MTLEDWKTHVTRDWAQIKEDVGKLKLKNRYQELVAISLTPILKQQVTADWLKSHDQGKKLAQTLGKLGINSKSGKKGATSKPLKKVVEELCQQVESDEDIEACVNWFIVQADALHGVQNDSDGGRAFCDDILKYLRENQQHASELRVRAQMIRAGHNVVIAGHNAKVVTTYYDGEKAALKSYLAGVRSDRDHTDIASIMPAARRHTNSMVHLHQLYTPMDIWVPEAADLQDEEKLEALHRRSVEQDLSHLRYDALESVAASPHLVVCGGAGTGKSTLVRFIATCLAYACDPDAEKVDDVNGLDLLGSSWVHGAILPVYVSLRHFTTHETFQKAQSRKSSQALLDYISAQNPGFSRALEKYLTNVDIPFDGTMLLLDGLDEVFKESDRVVLKSIIENWAKRFPRCRILVTTRSYAYKYHAEWRLSDRFSVAELAPYTWRQMQTYVDNWYRESAHVRPESFGGPELASSRADQLSKELVTTILESRELWSLARQPLLLALIVLIHEENSELPTGKAELYEYTIKLLHRWRRHDTGDPIIEKTRNLNWDRVRDVLQLIAFDLQRDHVATDKHKVYVERKDLLERLMQRQRDLGAPIEYIVEYLATRNGILVSGPKTTYRFLHQSLQEFLAACALIDQYDDCRMPEKLKPPKSDGGIWIFPANIAHLVRHDPYRWREVAMFVGAILARNRGQNGRWELIEYLLPKKKEGKLSEGELYSVYIAAEIWATAWIKEQLGSHTTIKGNLIKWLESSIIDDRLDAPERSRAVQILGQLQTDM